MKITLFTIKRDLEMVIKMLGAIEAHCMELSQDVALEDPESRLLRGSGRGITYPNRILQAIVENLGDFAHEGNIEPDPILVAFDQFVEVTYWPEVDTDM